MKKKQKQILVSLSLQKKKKTGEMWEPTLGVFTSAAKVKKKNKKLK